MYYPIGWPRRFRIGSPADIRSHATSTNGDLNSSCDINSNGHNDFRQSCDRSTIKQIAANSDRSLCLVISDDCLHIWFCKPSVEIVCQRRSAESIEALGVNEKATWRPDSSMIVVQTTSNFLFFVKVYMANAMDSVLNQIDVNGPTFRRGLFASEKIPALQLALVMVTEIQAGVSCLLAAEEEVVVATRDTGELLGVNWDGTLDSAFVWKLNDSPSFSTTERDSYVVDIKYSSVIGGFAVVFANGRAAYLPLNSTNRSESTTMYNGAESSDQQKYGPVKLQFLADVDNAVCTAINHKYQLIAFGLRNAEAVLCSIDDLTSAVVVTHRLTLSPSSFPDAQVTAGAMNNVQWSPDSTVLSTSWERGGLALWSVFGALITCSMSWDYGAIDNMKLNPFHVKSMAWSKEGYCLWLIHRYNASGNLNSDSPFELSQLSMAKSMLTSNPSSVSSSGESVLLVAEDRLYVGVGNYIILSEEKLINDIGKRKRLVSVDSEDYEANVPSTNAASGRMSWEQQPAGIGNHQWITIQMPASYLTSNWPIRFASIDDMGQCVAIAGRTGLAHYSLQTRKWKLFGNETQERDFEVCGGLIWWNDRASADESGQWVTLACYNVIESHFELRAYPAKMKLDNQHAACVKVPNEVLLMSLHESRLLTLLLDGSLHLYSFVRRTSGTVAIVKTSQIHITNLIVPPECVACIVLTRNLNTWDLEATAAAANCSPRSSSSTSSMSSSSSSSTSRPQHAKHLVPPESSESILINVCGKLFLLDRDNATGQSATKSPDNALNGNNVDVNDNSNGVNRTYRAVSKLASGVEHVWVSPVGTRTDRPYLTDALWLSCGANGMGVWLPLFPSAGDRSARAHTFMPKRIMLPVRTHIYPLTVLFRDAVVIGAENDTVFFGKGTGQQTLPFCVVSRTSQVYLHHLLRELLRRNLGYHSWEIANSCSDLPYFPHSLELLLHEVLEEEATSSQPIPDALLPRVIDFIREFPVFLQTVAHCARKTELALWPHLFAIVGNPKDLFQRCLEDGHLETAASYIIILQHLERTAITSKQHATVLLESARNTGRWQLAKDLLRFLRAIDPTDSDTTTAKASVHAAMKYLGSSPPKSNLANGCLDGEAATHHMERDIQRNSLKEASLNHY